MLITSLLPLLSRYSLGLDLIAGPDETVTLTIIPRKAEGTTHKPEGGEVRPITIIAAAAEIDAELAKGADGALGQLIAARKGLAEQLAEQRSAAEAAKTKSKPVAPKTPAPAAAEMFSTPSTRERSTPGEPASLW